MVYGHLETVKSKIELLELYKEVQLGKFNLQANRLPLCCIKAGSFSSDDGSRFDGTIHVLGYHLNNSNIEDELQDAAERVVRIVRQAGYTPTFVTFDEDVLDFLGFQFAQILPPEGAFRVDFTFEDVF